MSKIKQKKLLPSLRENQRYINFDIISEKKIEKNMLNQAIMNKLNEFLGILGMAKANIMLINNEKTNIIRVNNKYINEVKTALMLINNINNNKVIIRSKGVSGILNKAVSKYT